MLKTIVADLRVALRYPGRELRLMLAWLREPQLWLATLAALGLAALAYQWAPGAALHIGGDRATRLRWFDQPFLEGFHDPEPDRPGADWWALSEPPYRWSEPEATVRLPALGGGPWLIALTAGSGRPDGSPAVAQLRAGAGRELAVTIAPGVRRYMLVGAAESGDLAIGLRSAPFVAPGDRRSLGVVVYGVDAQPLGGQARAPAPGQLAQHALVAALVYATARRLWLAARAALGLSALLGIGGAALLVSDPLGLAIATPGLAWLAAAALGLAPALLGATWAATRALGVMAAPAERGAAVGAALAGLATRVIGAMHPYARFSDLGFNVNNMLRAARGELLLSAGLPCEAGAGRAPYPPAQYVLLAPAELLLNSWDRAVLERLIQGGVALLESMGALAIWLLLRRLGAGRGAALLGAALYILPAPLLQAYSIGEMANLFGQALVPPLLLLLAAWPPQRQGRRWLAAAAALLAALLLSHTGVTISAACLVAAWGAAQLARPGDRRGLLALGGAGALAAAAALLLFYSAFLHLPAENRAQAQELAARTPPLICPPGRPLGEKLVATLGLGLGPGGSLTPPLVAAAAIGALALRRKRRLAILLAAIAAGTLLSLGTLLSSDQPVRWAHFLFPALCAAAGAGLAAWGRRGRAGAALALGLLGWALWFAADQWIRRIGDYLH